MAARLSRRSDVSRLEARRHEQADEARSLRCRRASDHQVMRDEEDRHGTMALHSLVFMIMTVKRVAPVTDYLEGLGAGR